MSELPAQCVECGTVGRRDGMVCDVDANPDTAYYWCKPCADYASDQAHQMIVSGAWDERDMEDERAMG
jgi:hypothetical protein